MSIVETISKDVLARVDELAQQYKRAEPFRHIVIDNFFEPSLASRLLEEFPAFELGNNVGDDGKPGRKSTFERIKKLGSQYEALDKAIQQRQFLDVVGQIVGIPDVIYDPFYLGGGTHENREGQSLDAHVDFNYHPSEGWHRRLNLIVYLNPEWQADWGGNLELFRDPYADATPAVRITPLFNRCVIFSTTEQSWHGFDRIRLPDDRKQLSRKSIALYFYSKQRPAEEIAGKHTTHYVGAQIPDRLRSGYTLTDEDVGLLRNLTANRDALMQRLYDENAALRQAHDAGFAGKMLYLLRRFYVRLKR
jgi:hypothetical protein